MPSATSNWQRAVSLPAQSWIHKPEKHLVQTRNLQNGTHAELLEAFSRESEGLPAASLALAQLMCAVQAETDTECNCKCVRFPNSIMAANSMLAAPPAAPARSSALASQSRCARCPGVLGR